MKKVFLAFAICLSLTAFAQKAPRKAFSTDRPPAEGLEWQAGEEINLSDDRTPQGVIYTATESGGWTFFIGKGACRSEEGRWLAVYPSSSLRSWSEDTLRFVIPHEQVADKVVKPMYNRTDGREFEFSPLTAYLKFELPSGLPPVREIRFHADKFISGSYMTKLDAKKVAVMLDSGERFRNIVLKGGGDGVIAPGEYSIPVFARQLPDGLKVEIEATDGNVAVRNIAVPVKLSLGKTKDLGVLRWVEAGNPPAEDGPKTEIGKILKEGRCEKVADVLWDTTFNVTSGLDYFQMTILTDTGGKQDIFLLRTDPSKGLDIKVAISDETNSSTWKRQPPSRMAARLDTESSPVYAAVNADFCDNREPIKPRGPVHCDGKIWAGGYSIDPKFPQQALSYVGVKFDGRMTIGPNSAYAEAQKSLKECTGAGVILVRDSLIPDAFMDSETREPRTAIGYTSENIVWILAVDARHGTSGMTYADLASLFLALGCTDAVNLDGGGSTIMLVRDPQTGEILRRNWPSDPPSGFGGRERPRLDAWTIVKR